MKPKLIGVWDHPDKSGVYYACFSCAKKHGLDLCGTPTGVVCCEFCKAPSDQNKLTAYQGRN